MAATEWGSTASSMAASQMFYLLLVPLFLLWLIYFKLSRRNLNKHAANIPGPPGYPIIGNLFDLMGSSHSKFFVYSTDIWYHLPSISPDRKINRLPEEKMLRLSNFESILNSSSGVCCGCMCVCVCYEKCPYFYVFCAFKLNGVQFNCLYGRMCQFFSALESIHFHNNRQLNFLFPW